MQPGDPRFLSRGQTGGAGAPGLSRRENEPVEIRECAQLDWGQLPREQLSLQPPGSGCASPPGSRCRPGCRCSQCGFPPWGLKPARCHDSGRRGALPGRPPPVSERTPPPPAPAVGRGRASCLTSVRGSEHGCGAEHRAVAAAAAAGGERSGRGLRFARGALSREARRRRGGFGGALDSASPPPAAPWAARKTHSKRNCCGT